MGDADLAYLMRDNSGFSELKTKQFIKKLCQQIARLHENNYIHGDIKPGNVLHGSDGSWNLIDFDRAKFCKSGTRIKAPFGGTFGFTAPELMHHGSQYLNIIDAGVDIWAVALLIIYCINGGNLGDIEVDILLRSKYNKAASDGNINLMKEAFQKYYNKMFINNLGVGFLTETRRLLKEKKISLMLYDLLSKMLVKDTVERFSISEVLAHKWFKVMNDSDDIDEILEVVEECEHSHNYLSMCSAFGSLQVTNAYPNDSLVDSDYNDLLNGSTSFYESMDAINDRESMLNYDDLYNYDEDDEEKDKEEEMVKIKKVSIRISELF